jgi:asparagine synthetase B (glutamine-hydrolysing)
MAKKGAASKWGYIFAHSAIVFICLGGLLDGDLFTRAQIWFGGKSILPASTQGMLISDIPSEHKLNMSGGKIVLKSALARHVPRHLFERPKMGFAVPLASWLAGPLKEWVYACTNQERIRREGFLDSGVVENLVRLVDVGDDWHAYKLWAVCIFQSWLEDCHEN